MWRRILLFSAAALLARASLGDEPAAAGRWQATAIPWNRSLPAVEITFGYPGNYAPTGNSPIELKASATASPFDGFIGYRFVVGRSKTTDVPVVSRATLPTGGTWSFATTAQLQFWAADNLSRSDRKNRELVIQWYDRSMHVIAQHNVGQPPWSDTRPLLVVRDAAAKALPQYLGAAPVVMAQKDLGSSAQWYRGFSHVVAQLELWLDLPASTRQKIFYSGVNLVAFGPPRPDQHFTDVDRAMIPVEFNSAPSETSVSRLRGTVGPKRSFPMSWRAAVGAVAVGSETSPYLVVSSAGAYAADESVLSSPLPAVRILWPDAEWRLKDKTVVHDRIHIYWEQFRPVWIFVLALLVSAAIWPLITRKHEVIAAVLALVFVGAAITARSSIRRTSGQSVQEVREILTATTMLRTIEYRSFGPSPLPATAVSRDAAEWWTAQLGTVREDAEIRAKTTPPGHGAVVISTPWDTTTRFLKRRELTVAPTLRVRAADDAKIVVDLDPRIPARYIAVRWRGSKNRLFGIRPLVPGQKQATVHSFDRLPGIAEVWWWGVFRSHEAGSADVVLVEQRPGYQVVTSLSVRAESLTAFDLVQRLSRDSDRAQSGAFVLPVLEQEPGTEAETSLTLPPDASLKAIRLTGPRGTIDLMAAPLRKRRSIGGHYTYSTDIRELRRIAGDREVIRLDIETTEPVSDNVFARLTVRRKASS